MSAARERWSIVATDMAADEVEAQVVLRNGARFGGKVKGNPATDSFLHLRTVVDNSISPARPTVIDHVVDWDEIAAISGAWAGHWVTTSSEPVKTLGGPA